MARSPDGWLHAWPSGRQIEWMEIPDWKFLVIADEPALRESKMLSSHRRLGHDTFGVRGRRRRGRWRDKFGRDPDRVLCDLVSSGSPALECNQAHQAPGRTLPVVMMKGNGTTTRGEAMRRAAVFTKPPRSPALYARSRSRPKSSRANGQTLTRCTRRRDNRRSHRAEPRDSRVAPDHSSRSRRATESDDPHGESGHRQRNYGTRDTRGERAARPSRSSRSKPPRSRKGFSRAQCSATAGALTGAYALAPWCVRSWPAGGGGGGGTAHVPRRIADLRSCSSRSSWACSKNNLGQPLGGSRERKLTCACLPPRIGAHPGHSRRDGEQEPYIALNVSKESRSPRARADSTTRRGSREHFVRDFGRVGRVLAQPSFRDGLGGTSDRWASTRTVELDRPRPAAERRAWLSSSTRRSCWLENDRMSAILSRNSVRRWPPEHPSLREARAR